MKQTYSKLIYVQNYICLCFFMKKADNFNYGGNKHYEFLIPLCLTYNFQKSKTQLFDKNL